MPPNFIYQRTPYSDVYPTIMHSSLLGSTQYNHLALRATVACNVHALIPVLRDRYRPEALRRGAVLYVLVPEDVRISCRAVARCFWSESTCSHGKGHFDHLETCRGHAVPATMERDIHAGVV